MRNHAAGVTGAFDRNLCFHEGGIEERGRLYEGNQYLKMVYFHFHTSCKFLSLTPQFQPSTPLTPSKSVIKIKISSTTTSSTETWCRRTEFRTLQYQQKHQGAKPIRARRITDGCLLAEGSERERERNREREWESVRERERDPQMDGSGFFYTYEKDASFDKHWTHRT